MERASVVIPLHPSHERHLPELFANLLTDEESIEEIIIARGHTRSSTSHRIGERLRGIFDVSGLTAPLIIDLTEEPRTAGQNKNSGWALASGKWTAFVDADDLYHPQRLQLLLSLGVARDIDILIHAFATTVETWSTSVDMATLVKGHELFALTFPGGIRDRHQEGSHPGDTNVVIPEGSGPAHQGHVVLATDLRRAFRFSDLPRGEDGQLNRDLLWSGRSMLYVDQPLSHYRMKNSTLHNSLLRRWRSRIRHRRGLMP